MGERFDGFVSAEPSISVSRSKVIRHNRIYFLYCQGLLFRNCKRSEAIYPSLAPGNDKGFESDDTVARLPLSRCWLIFGFSDLAFLM